MITQTQAQLQRLVPRHHDAFDVVIVGAGPAGMSAALCCVRANLKTLVLEKALPGGEASTAWRIENYLGFPGGILGPKLTAQMEDQLFSFPIYYSCENVEDIAHAGDAEKIIRTELGSVYKAKAVIIAVGLEPKKLNAGFEKAFMGRGVSYYAQCDVESYRGKDVAVIGGGTCACYAADYLSGFVNKLYLIHRSDSLKAVKTLKERILGTSNISLMWDSVVDDVFGLDKVEKIKIRHSTTQQHTWVDVKGVFIYVGRIPPKDILNLNIRTDERGYIVTDETMRTNISGIYAAGDIRAKQIRQIATAVSDGMIAAINAERDLKR
ncbi:MAG: NAD(P)/FAD-dependent oxidoreductase [Candidatus Margulisiibacteriota bacterium]